MRHPVAPSCPQPGLRSEILLLRDWLDTGLPLETPKVTGARLAWQNGHTVGFFFLLKLFAKDIISSVVIKAAGQVSIHSAAETLLIFLESLREPIIPFTLFHK